MLIEACIDDPTSARNAIAGGAGRLELCDNLADGGTTPSHGMLAHLLETVSLPVFPIIRPRGGGFTYDAAERDVMLRNLAHARSLGAPGAVIGALTTGGHVDRDTVARLREVAGDMSLTFHRAFDRCRDPFESLEVLVELGIDRILTSGQRARAWEGRELIADLVRRAGDRITIMAGGGVSESDVADLVRSTGVTEIHARASMIVRDDPGWESWAIVPFRKALPGDEAARVVTDPHRVRAIREAAGGHEPGDGRG